MRYIYYFSLCMIGASATKYIIDLIFHKPYWSASWIDVIIISLVITIIEFLKQRRFNKIGKNSEDDF